MTAAMIEGGDARAKASSATVADEACAKSAKHSPDGDAATAAHNTASNNSNNSNSSNSSSSNSRGRPKTKGRRGAKTHVVDDEPPAPRPAYYMEGGLRRVQPYFFTYRTWVKERWRGRTILAVFESEFRDRPVAYYRQALETGRVTVDARRVGPDHVLRNGERIQHAIHRHEPPVTPDPIAIIHEDADMIVIDKPAGVPVHPAGRYLYNSVVEILKAERAAAHDPDFVPYPCNRLDRLTSGIMFLAKSPAAARRLSVQIQERAVRKEYVARVVGRFPDGAVVCNQPILQISPKLGLNRVRASGRAARTVFQRLAYYGGVEGGEGGEGGKGGEGGEGGEDRNIQDRGYSIVRCLPVTGRTHQIRVHLQYLGHPIENDPIYANLRVWGGSLGRGDADATAVPDATVMERLARMGKEDVADAVAYYDGMVDAYHAREAEKLSGAVCAVCATPLYTDPGAHELALWLHSLRYQAVDGAWRYESALPAWARPPAGAAGPADVGDLEALVAAAQAAGPLEGEDDEATVRSRLAAANAVADKAARRVAWKKQKAARQAVRRAAHAEGRGEGEGEGEETEDETVDVPVVDTVAIAA